jgi:ABC-2 type transport system ATP-binding protein
MDANELVINTQGLGKTYGEFQALRPLELRVPRHAIFGFLGPNGAGKTTTIKLLLGLTRPSTGSGTIFGQDIVEQSVDIRQRIGYLAQDPRFYGHMSARETLRYKAGFYYRGPAEAVEERVAETLELVGLSERADRPVKGFSGGERQRLGIAQAQINHPDLLILDEPAAALDPGGRRDVLDIMERLREHTTIFFSTHILDDVQRVSDAVAILKRGELVAQASIDELLAGGAGGTAYLLELEGDAGPARARIEALPWVSNVESSGEGERTRWQVSVTDEEAARAQLLRSVLADERLTVVRFDRRRYDLEEIFLDIVEGDDRG